MKQLKRLILVAITGLCLLQSLHAQQPRDMRLPPVPGSIEDFVSRGYRFMQQKDYTEAIKVFREALGMDRNHKGARFGLGTALIQIGRIEYAVRILEPMLSQYPDDYTLKNNVAWMYATAEDPAMRNAERAIELAQDALLLAPNDFHVWSTLAEACYIDGQYERALRAAEQGLALMRQSVKDPERIQEYVDQVNKCRRAVEAMSILD